MERLDYHDIYRRYKGFGSIKDSIPQTVFYNIVQSIIPSEVPIRNLDKGLHTESTRNMRTDSEAHDTATSQRLSQKYESGQFFDSSDDENKNTESDSDFYQPGKSKKKHKIKFKNIKGLLTSNNFASSNFRFSI